jgi:hypothetical protein
LEIENKIPPSTPPELVARVNDMMRAAEPLPQVTIDPPTGQSALDSLGPSPFPKRGFPFLGFLSGIYDHVSTTAHQMANPQPATPISPQATDN